MLSVCYVCSLCSSFTLLNLFVSLRKLRKKIILKGCKTAFPNLEFTEHTNNKKVPHHVKYLGAF